MQIKAELLEVMGSDEAVAYAAWASSGKNKDRTREDIDRLLKRIIEDGHDGCLEHVVFRFKVDAPLYILTQMLRHRAGNSYNAASGRYQYPFTDYLFVPNDVKAWANPSDVAEYDRICREGIAYYQAMVEKYATHPRRKRILEVLRGALPTATMSSLILTVNLRAWLNFYKQRADAHAQPEIQSIARQMRALIEDVGQIKTIVGLLQWRLEV